MPKRPRSKQPYRLIIIGLIVSGLLISIPAVLSLEANRQLSDSFNWVAHTLNVQRQVQHLLSLLNEAETGNRGFRLSHREEYLEPYNAALKQIPGYLKSLERSTSDNPVQQANLRQLELLVKAKLGIMAESISLQREGKLDASMDFMDRGKQTMDAIRAQLNLIDREEARLLASRQETLAANFHADTTFLFGLIALNGVFAAAMLISFNRLQKVRNLVTICAWSHTIEYQNEWLSIDQYLSRRFNIESTHGISPYEFEKAMANIDSPAPAEKENEEHGRVL